MAADLHRNPSENPIWLRAALFLELFYCRSPGARAATLAPQGAACAVVKGVRGFFREDVRPESLVHMGILDGLNPATPEPGVSVPDGMAAL